jgi:hypothetical protein
MSFREFDVDAYKRKLSLAIASDVPKGVTAAKPIKVVATAVDPPIYALVGLCRAAGLPEPTPEYEFHPTRKFRFDYALPEHKIAIEVEGGIWREGGGAHSHPSNILRDLEKYNEAACLGWRVLRVVPEKLTEAVLLIARAIGRPSEAA